MKKYLFLAVTCLFVAGMTSCKPKVSAYHAAWERAQERAVAENKSVSTDEVVPVIKPAAPSTPVVVEQPLEEVPTVSERIQPAKGENANELRAYSIVIGSFLNITNAKALKERMASEGFTSILAQNEKGMYRVIVSSFDTKADAVAAREAVKDRFAPLFQDAWILQRAY